MKKYAAVLAAVLLSLVFTTTAADSLDIWIDSKENTVSGSELMVPVLTNGSATDGLITLTYDPAILSLEEADVIQGNSVEMYSVNVLEEGTIKISYLCPKASKTEVLFTLKFDVKNAQGGGFCCSCG